MKKTAIHAFLCLALIAALAVACAPAYAQQIYRWTDKSGQENFTDDINNVPAEYRSKFKANDKPADASQSKPKADVVQPDSDEPQSPGENSDVTMGYSAPIQETSGSVSKNNRRAEKLRSKLTDLKSALAKANDDLNNAFLWETMVHTPQYTQKKIQAQKDIDVINEKIKTTQAELDRINSAQTGNRE